MHIRDHLSLSDIARRTGLSCNTVKKWVKAPIEVEPRYRRGAIEGKLSAFEQTLVYEGGYSRLTDFIRAWRQKQGQSVQAKAFVPLLFEWGEPNLKCLALARVAVSAASCSLCWLFRFLAAARR